MSLCRQHRVNVTASDNTKLMSLLQATQRSGCNFPIRHCFKQKQKGLVVMSQRSCCDLSVRNCFWQHKANFPARHCFRQHRDNVTASGNTEIMSLLQATQRSGCNSHVRHCFRQHRDNVTASGNTKVWL